jgi:hypothetical protein
MLGFTVAQIYKALCLFFGELRARTAADLKTSRAFRGSALYLCWISIQGHKQSRRWGRDKKTASFVLIRAEIGPTGKWWLLEREFEMPLNNRKAPIPRLRF